MKISIEISMYPLDKEYGTSILDFIHRLKKHPQITTKTNSMSTQVFGEYDEVFQILKQEIKTSFLEEKDILMVMKMANLNLE